MVLRPIRDGTLILSLIRKTGEARDQTRAHDPWFSKGDALPLHHSSFSQAVTSPTDFGLSPTKAISVKLIHDL